MSDATKPRERPWAVTVAVEGEEILTIESASLSGVSNVEEFRKEILCAAEHLRCFIGTGEEEFSQLEDQVRA
jgi:hypothetical protein